MRVCVWLNKMNVPTWKEHFVTEGFPHLWSNGRFNNTLKGQLKIKLLIEEDIVDFNSDSFNIKAFKPEMMV